ncbi:MAG: hypothetical protein ABSH14_08625 [Verrucomicrobiia bacterium]|jgi:hypothetical protein
MTEDSTGIGANLGRLDRNVHNNLAWLQVIVALLFTLLVTSGCSTTTFTEYRGANIVEGKGGTVRVVNGIDFWENGDPNRKYKILGVIDDSRGEGIISRSSRDDDIAQAAHERGADAVIFAGSDREFRGVDLNSGGAYYKRITKLIAVKYVR